MIAYHRGERAVQERVGVVTAAERNARGRHTELPGVASEFLAGRPFIVAGWVAADGRLWCSLLAGPRGFLDTPDEGTLRIAASLPGVTDGDEVGLLAIEPETRRRVRVNGRIRHAGDGALVVDVGEVVSNCPRYITRRAVSSEAATTAARSSTVVGERLTDEHVAWIRGADTFFLATTGGEEGGVDASHRGGEPGFVEVVGDRQLRWRDYPGNAMFLSLGNLGVDSRAALLFVDWDSGATLQLSGRARVEWDDDGEREVLFDVGAT